MEKEFVIPGENLDSLGEASSNIKKTLKSLGAAPKSIKRTAISMYEAEVNTAIHGGGGIGNVSISSQEIIIKFKDNGPGIPDINMAMQEGFSTAPDYVREIGFGAGMGLPNIKRNSDFMELKSEKGKGTEITIKINLKETPDNEQPSK